MNVSDVMTADPVTVDVGVSLQRAFAVLDELDVRHLPVVEEGRLAGILSDRDLREVRALVNERREHTPRVADLMSADVVSVHPETDLLEVIQLMLEEKFGAVPVVDDDDRVIGIVSYVDLLREFGKTLSSED